MGLTPEQVSDHHANKLVTVGLALSRNRPCVGTTILDNRIAALKKGFRVILQIPNGKAGALSIAMRDIDLTHVEDVDEAALIVHKAATEFLCEDTAYSGQDISDDIPERYRGDRKVAIPLSTGISVKSATRETNWTPDDRYLTLSGLNADAIKAICVRYLQLGQTTAIDYILHLNSLGDA